MRLLIFVALTLTLLTASFGVMAQANQPQVLLLTAEGPVTSAMDSYIERGLANAAGYDLVILQLNTPGGSVALMNAIVQKMRNSTVPIVVYVAPNGAMAASAGTIITLAGHANAMAPETTIGAASPVGAQGEDIGETMLAKEKNVLRATVRSLAQGRPTEAIALAEETIESAKAISSAEALEIGLTDFIASDTADLLRQLDGCILQVSGQSVTLHTQNALTKTQALTWIEQILMMLTNPNLVFLLLTIGIQALIIELSHPGGWVAGFIGVVCIALAVYAFGVLPINYVGLIFIILSFVLFFLDIKAPTHGALTAAGIGTFIAGALILFNSVRAPGFPKVSIPLVVGTGIFLALSFAVIVRFAIKALRIPPQMGKESMGGQIALVRTDLAPEGTVQMAGELWSAEPVDRHAHIPAGSKVRVTRVDGLRLIVEPVENSVTPDL